MHLQNIDSNKIHISHFHHFVSAYETNKKTVEELVELIEEGIKTAKASRIPVVIDQDCIDHVFIAFPSGNIRLYREVGVYRVIRDES